MTGRPVSSRSSTSRFFSSAPPPVSTMPLSTMSADSSGGVRSRALRTASTMALMGSARASRISSELTVDGLGHAGHEVAALDLHGERLVERVGVADGAS
jgi:hypothetical protein